MTTFFNDEEVTFVHWKILGRVRDSGIFKTDSSAPFRSPIPHVQICKA
jgi:hypothetical protein